MIIIKIYYPRRLTTFVNKKLKTISLRLQGMSDDGEEVLDLQANLEAMFNKLGLTLWNTDGSLKNTYTILKDLSEVYPTLTSEAKAYVTEQIAGKYQAQ